MTHHRSHLDTKPYPSDHMDDLIKQIKADPYRIHQPNGFGTSKEKQS